MNAGAMCAMLLTSSCAMVGVPDARNINIPAPTQADERKLGVNERPDSVMYLPLGEDVLVPDVAGDESLPSEMVGPFELRGETLAGALQIVLADYDISLAFETQEGLSRRITVSNLRGDLGKVVNEICSLANLYCAYHDGSITVKDTQTFTVTLPPIGGTDESQFLTDVSTGLAAILGGTQPIVDPTTRTIIYTATQRTAEVANRYFQRLRANTAMIVFETYIWEVSLNSGNSMGVDWSALQSFGKFNTGFVMNGSVGADFTDPISIGLPTTQDFTGTSGDLVSFLSQFGAVKTISQPQITVLSGSEAELRVADTQNYVSQIATTLDQGQSTTSVNTDSVDTGFTLRIGSTWDKSTVYANVNIELTDVKKIDDFTFSDTGSAGGSTTIQLPQTSERQLATQIRVRPGDSLLIAGLVREGDNFDKRGLGLMEPVIPDSRTAEADNLELVILLRPRVVVYTAANDKRYVDYAMKKHKVDGAGVDKVSEKTDANSTEYKNISAPKDAVTAKSVLAPKDSFTKMPDEEPVVSMTPSKERVLVAPPSMAATKADPVPLLPSSANATKPSAGVAGAPSKTSSPPMPSVMTPQVSAAPQPSASVDDSSRFRLGSGMVSKDSYSERAKQASQAVLKSAQDDADAKAAQSPFDLPPPAQKTLENDGNASGSYQTFDYSNPKN